MDTNSSAPISPMPSNGPSKSRLVKGLLIAGLIIAVVGTTYIANDAGLFQGQLKLNRNNPAVNMGGQNQEVINLGNKVGNNLNLMNEAVDRNVRDKMVRVQDVGGVMDKDLGGGAKDRLGMDINSGDRLGLLGNAGGLGGSDIFGGHNNKPGEISDGRGMASDGGGTRGIARTESTLGAGEETGSGSRSQRTTKQHPDGTVTTTWKETRTYETDPNDGENQPKEVTYEVTEETDPNGNPVNATVIYQATYEDGTKEKDKNHYPQVNPSECPPDQECGDSGQSMEQAAAEICRNTPGCNSATSPSELLRLMMEGANCDERNESCMNRMTGGAIDWENFFARVNSAGGNCDGRNDDMCFQYGGGFNASQEDLAELEGVGGGGPDDPAGGR